MQMKKPSSPVTRLLIKSFVPFTVCVLLEIILHALPAHDKPTYRERKIAV